LCQRKTFYLGIIILVVVFALVSLSGCKGCNSPEPDSGEEGPKNETVKTKVNRFVVSLRERLGGDSGGNETSSKFSEILFEDDFSKCEDWAEYSDAASASSCVGDALELSVSIPQHTTWSIPGKGYGDCAIEVDATHKRGPIDSSYGLVFRYVDSANFFEFDVSGNGFYSLGKFVDDEWIPLIDWTEDSRIHKGHKKNHLGVEILGKEIVLFINGNRIVTCTDTGPGSSIGDVGVVANTFEQGGIVIQFDNFRVRE